jgi:hypothetical protein
MVLAKTMFCYGCASLIAATGAFFMAIFGRGVFPGSLLLVEALFLIHAGAFLITFDRDARRRRRAPLFEPTRNRVRLSRLLLCAAIVNALICGSIFFSDAHKASRADAGLILPVVVAALVIVSALYITLHWAFRPENFVPPLFIALFSDPIGMFFFRRWRRKRHVRDVR